MSTARVDFTRGAAERIARVVRLVEQGDRNQSGPTWERVPGGGGGGGVSLKVATFSGDWAVGESKVVTLYGSTNTASVYNWCNPAVGGDTASTAESRYVIFGRAGGENSVVEIQAAPPDTSCTLTLGGVDLTTIAGYSSTEIQLLGHGAAEEGSTCVSGLQWYSISTCGTATSTP